MGRANTGEVFSGIYKITNLINGKFYIGQSVDVNNRLYVHQTDRNSGHAIDTAIAKYGKENFSYEVLEKCEQEDLLVRERYWAEEVFHGECYAPKGYNICRTGIGSIKINPISRYTLDGEYIDTYYSSNDAGRAMGVSGVAIRQAENNHGTCCGYLWRYGISPKIKPYMKPDLGVPVKCYDENGRLVLEFKNGVEAAKYFGITPAAISAFILHKTGYRTCGGLYLSKDDDPPVIRDINTANHYRVPCYEYDLSTGNLIGEYTSIKEAANGRDSKSIRNALNGIQHKAYGSRWSYQKYERIPEVVA